MIALGLRLILSSYLFQRVLEIDAAAVEHEFIFSDEVGFNLAKRRESGRNVIRQRGGNITMCAAINYHGVVHHRATLSPNNTARLITFLDTLQNTLIPSDQLDGPEKRRYFVIRDNVSFHRSALVHEWFIDHTLFSSLSPSILCISLSN